MLIVKTGTTVSNVVAERGDFEAWIARGMGLREDSVHVCRVYEGDALPDPSMYQGVVITGSSAMVTERLDWSERTAAWLRETVGSGVPVLGICYGHQLLAHAFGGEVANNPRGRHIGTVDVELTREAASNPLFRELDPVLHVPVSHFQSVLQLPAQATRLASAARDPNHAFAIGERAWGVQFHPEFDADIVRGYVAARRELIAAEGLDALSIERDARDTDHGASLLRRFAALCAREPT